MHGIAQLPSDCCALPAPDLRNAISTSKLEIGITWVHAIKLPVLISELASWDGYWGSLNKLNKNFKQYLLVHTSEDNDTTQPIDKNTLLLRHY